MEKLPFVDALTLERGLLPDHLGVLDGADAALVLGQCRYGEELLSKIAGRGVHVLVIRTIGMDHIDLDVAARLGIAVGNAHYAPDSVADFTLMLVTLRHYKAAVYQQNVNDYSLQRARRQDALLSCQGRRRYRRHRRCRRAEALRLWLRDSGHRPSCEP